MMKITPHTIFAWCGAVLTVLFTLFCVFAFFAYFYSILFEI